MNDGNASRVLVGIWALACVTIIVTEIKKHKRIPHPTRFISAGMTYGILGFAAPMIGPSLAMMVGAGFYLVLVYRYYNAADPTADSKGALGNLGQAIADVTTETGA